MSRKKWRHNNVKTKVNVDAILLPYRIKAEEEQFRSFYLGNPYVAENILKDLK